MKTFLGGLAIIFAFVAGVMLAPAGAGAQPGRLPGQGREPHPAVGLGSFEARPFTQPRPFLRRPGLAVSALPGTVYVSPSVYYIVAPVFQYEPPISPDSSAAGAPAAVGASSAIPAGGQPSPAAPRQVSSPRRSPAPKIIDIPGGEEPVDQSDPTAPKIINIPPSPDQARGGRPTSIRREPGRAAVSASSRAATRP